MPRYRRPKTFPKDGRRVLGYIDFKDGDPIPGWRMLAWKEDARGFNLLDSENGGGWHVKGLVAWTPLPDAPH